MKLVREAFEFVDNLERLPTVDAVMDATQRTLGLFGFVQFSFSGVPRDSTCMPDVVLAHRIPGELFKLYVERRYADVDPVMRMLRRTNQPFKWLDVPYDRERERKGAELMGLVADFGLSQGFFVPTQSPAGTPGNVWMSGQAPELTDRSRPALHFMALYAFDRVYRLVGPKSARRPSLTAREREVLAWTASGKSAWEIGEILGIAKRTVDEHAQTAVRKLGAANKIQAVVFAIRDRLIDV